MKTKITKDYLKTFENKKTLIYNTLVSFINIVENTGIKEIDIHTEFKIIHKIDILVDIIRTFNNDEIFKKENRDTKLELLLELGVNLDYADGKLEDLINSFVCQVERFGIKHKDKCFSNDQKVCYELTQNLRLKPNKKD